MSLNWKFEQWKQQQKSGFDDIETYISLNISAEDIEIFSRVLLPNIIEYNGGFLNTGVNNSTYEIELVKKTFDDSIKLHSIPESEKIVNELNISDIFFNTIDSTHISTISNIAILIKNNWEYFLLKNYTEKEFIVELNGDSHEPFITFYQKVASGLG